MNSTVDRLIIGTVAGSLFAAFLVALLIILKFGPAEEPQGGALKPQRLADDSIRISEASDPEIRRLLTEKRWDDAIVLLEPRAAVAPEDRRLLGFALLNRAAEALNPEHPDRPSLAALGAEVDRALLLVADDAELSLEGARCLAALGIIAHEENDAALGRRWIEEAARRAGNDPYVCYVRGALLVREGNYAEAAPLLALGAQSPDTAVSAASRDLAGRIRADVVEERGFAVSQSDRFVIRYEGPPRPDLAMRFTSLLERQGPRVAAVIGREPARRVEVILYTSGSLGAARGLPDWIGGVFDGRIRVSLGDAEIPEARLADILAHEYTHAAIHEMMGRPLPVWFEEGVAQTVERGGAADWESLRVQLAGGPPPALAALSTPFVRMDAHAARRAYAASFAAVSLLIEKSGAGAIPNILADLGRGDAMDDALRRSSGMTVDEVSRAVETRLGDR